MRVSSNVVALPVARPNDENGNVVAPLSPRRVPNAARRSRERLTPAEVARMIKAAGAAGRHGPRDAALLLIAYRHGLRVSELVWLRWEQLDMTQGLLHVNRNKNGVASTHLVRGSELRALRGLQRSYSGPYVFATERSGPMTPATVRKIVARAAELAKLPFPVHPHMLRHACGFKLANKGHDSRASGYRSLRSFPAGRLAGVLPGA